MAETFEDYTKQDKHVYVLRLVRQFVGEEDFIKYYNYIDGTISFIITQILLLEIKYWYNINGYSILLDVQKR
jgi:hypothetical protein